MQSARTSLSLAALLASTFVQAAEPLPYEANFDSSGGFALGGLDGQRGWSVEDGKAVITDGEGREGTRALRLEPSDPVGSVGLTVATGERGNILYSDLYLRPGATNPDAIRTLLRDLITRNYLTQDLSSRVWENAVSGQVLKSIVIKIWTVSNPVDPGITTAEDLANTDPLIPLYTQIATTSGTPDTKVIIVDYKYGSP